jgi:hypothetical protein
MPPTGRIFHAERKPSPASAFRRIVDRQAKVSAPSNARQTSAELEPRAQMPQEKRRIHHNRARMPASVV